MNADPRAVSNSSMAILDSIQSKTVDEQILGASVVFLAVSERFGIEPSILLNAVDNLRRYSRRYDKATFKGIEQYFKHEIN